VNGDRWGPVARAIRNLPRSMFHPRSLSSLARAIVAHCAYAMVLDPYATARAKDKAVMTFVKMLQSFERIRHRPDDRSSRAPLAEPDRSGTLARVPLDVLLASVSSASELAKRGGDSIKKADPH
jgi:hypothetical protein